MLLDTVIQCFNLCYISFYSEFLKWVFIFLDNLQPIGSYEINIDGKDTKIDTV